MKASFKLFVAISLLVGIFSIHSCVKKKYPVSDFKLSQWDPIIGAPLVNIELNLVDINLNRDLSPEELAFINNEYPGFNYTEYQNFNIPVFPRVIDADDFEFWFDAPVGIDFIPDFNNVKRADFRIRTINNFPFNSDIQLYLLDGNNLSVDSLLLNGNDIVESGDVVLTNEGGSQFYESVSDKTRFIDVPFTGYRLDQIKRAEKIICRVKGLRPGVTDSVLVQETTRVNLKLSVKITDFDTDVDLNN